MKKNNVAVIPTTLNVVRLGLGKIMKKILFLIKYKMQLYLNKLFIKIYIGWDTKCDIDSSVILMTD